ncbi:glycosyltransferase family 2 protein [Leptospira bouyouniensis]|uniref:glycosyltransferase family 2 protein n=1 Tax=Leptospira bouyouniensis TaxID=2484911 RepID=UPI001090BE7D|nr:glycosyltransferase family 2 protein [Leptospira bouyouniensis]TGM80947.1 glycosyltransferase [Leptospira bouyouniensis]
MKTQRKKPKLVSVVVPSFNEEGNIRNLFNRIMKNFKSNEYLVEVIFVNDGSTDGTLDQIKVLSKEFKSVKYISFSRNFGHQKALKAGLDYSNGDAVISLDADLQHPPELIADMIKLWEKGYEVVYTIRKDIDTTPIFKRFTAVLFYKILNKLSGLNISQGAADFRLLDRKVVKVIREMQEENLFIRGMIPWLGFNQISLEYEPEERVWGTSKYTIKKMFLFALQGITSFSVKPLHLTTYLGALIFLLSSFYICYALFIYFVQNKSIPGWTSMLISVLFLGSLNLLMLGVLGEYIGKIMIESKRRPQYIIKDKNL